MRALVRVRARARACMHHLMGGPAALSYMPTVYRISRPGSSYTHTRTHTHTHTHTHTRWPGSAGGEPAQISKVWSGFKKECCSDADNFQVLYPAVPSSLHMLLLQSLLHNVSYTFFYCRCVFTRQSLPHSLYCTCFYYRCVFTTLLHMLLLQRCLYYTCFYYRCAFATHASLQGICSAVRTLTTCSQLANPLICVSVLSCIRTPVRACMVCV